jgi:hypothetical protein
MKRTSIDLKRQLLLAAVDCSGGDTTKTFTFEELLVAAWKRDNQSWGLRGFEAQYPDSERIHRELDSRGNESKGLVELGWVEKVRARVYQLTLKGLAEVGRNKPENTVIREKIRRESEEQIRRVVEHPVFRQWLEDSSKPRKFREAGSFWGIAPGTPPAVIRRRVHNVDEVLTTALNLLKEAGTDALASGRGTLLFEENDLQRVLQFQRVLKERFSRDLRVLGVDVGLHGAQDVRVL